jgi:hypothetical protein
VSDQIRTTTVHDNDFIAERSWWLTVYSKQPRPWDPTQLAIPLSEEAKARMWKRYEEIIAQAAELKSTNAVLGTRDWENHLPK